MKTIKHTFTSILLLCLVTFGAFKANAQTTLAAGDMAIVGMNTTANKVQFVTFKQLSINTEIYLTDYGWDNTNGVFHNNSITAGEGLFKWVVVSEIPAGTIFEMGFSTSGTPVVYTLKNLTTNSDITSSVTALKSGGGDFFLGTGENFFIYQGGTNDATYSIPIVSPKFICGFNNCISTSGSANIDATGWSSPFTAGFGVTSSIPNATGTTGGGLANAVNAIGMVSPKRVINVWYTGSTTATDAATWTSRLSNISNWSGDGTGVIVTSLSSPLSIGTTPSFTGSTTKTVCQNTSNNSITANLVITDAAAAGTVTETWSITSAPTHGTLGGFSATASSTGGSVSPSGLTYTPTNGYTGSDAFTIQISNGNATASQTVTVTVNAAPNAGTIQVSSGSLDSLCATASSSIYTTGTGGGIWTTTDSTIGGISPNSSTIYTNYSYGGTATTATFLGASTNNAKLIGGTVTMTYTVLGTGGCADASTSRIFAVRRFSDTGTISPASGATLCVNATLTYSSTSATDGLPRYGGVKYGHTWTSTNTAVATVNSSTGIVTAKAAGTANIRYTTSPNGCGSWFAQRSLIVVAAANAGTISGATSVCANATTTLTSNGTSGGSWSSDNDALATVNSSGVVTGVSAGTATISYVVTSGSCTATATKAITIQSSYTLTASAGTGGSISSAGATSVCSGNNQSYAITASSGYNISDVLVDGVSQGAISSYTFSNVTASHTISASFALACSPTSSSTTHTACGSYVWGGVTYTTSGTKTKTGLTNAAGCDSTATLDLTINVATSSITTQSSCDSYTWGGTAYTSSGTYTQTGLTNAAGCDSTATLNLTINTATSSSSSIIILDTQLPCSWNGNSYATAGTYTVHLTNAAGCDSAATLTLSVTSSCVPTTSTNDVSICPSALPYSWNGLTFNVAGTQTAHLTNAGGCDSAATLNVTTKPSPAMTSINSGTANISTATLCTLGTTVRYYNNTPYGVWSSNNAAVASVSSTGSGGNVTANTNGTATISYSIAAPNGCVSAATLLVTVAQQATPNAITGGSSLCAGQTMALASTTLGGTWNSSNNLGTINAAGVYTGVNAGNYGEVRYTVTNASGCSAYASKTITVNAIPGVPTIGYAPGSNAALFRYGSDFCNGKSFTVVGTPAGGSWIYTNPAVATINGSGLVTLIGVGNGAIVYTYTNANGCSNSRYMPGTVANCPIPKGVSRLEGQLSTVNDFTMYPNPAKTFIRLNVETLIGKGTVVITDLYGKQVKTQALSMGTNIIDIANLGKGMYFVSTITSEGKTTKKLVVQ